MKNIYKDANGRVRVGTLNDKPSMTDQSFADETNINKIMKKYHATGMITHLNRRKGAFMDLSEIGDYQTSLNTVIAANNAFMALPSDIRKRFGNDPQQVLEFLADSNNRDEAIKLGLVKAPTVQTNDDLTTNDKTKEPTE